MPSLFTNNASATLASSISSSATTITVSTGQGALFPTLTAGEYFYATLTDSSNNLEIIKVTGRASDVLTVLRGQDGTTARAYAAADRVELRVTAAVLQNLVQLDGAQTITGAKTFSTAPTLSTPLAVASGGSGVTTSTGSGNNVLSNSPTLVTPNLGTPSVLVGTNITGTASGLSIGGNAATASNPASGGSFITSSNIGSQSVNYASSAGSASSASTATTASSASYASSAGQVSGGLVWRQHSTSSFTVGYGSWNNTLCTLGADYYSYLIQIYWSYSGAYPSYFCGSAVMGGHSGMLNAQSSSTQVTLAGTGAYGEQCYINTQASGGQHYSPPYIYAYWFNKQGFSNLAPSSLTATCVIYILTN